MEKKICFDMDGTIADLYGKSDWLERLREFDPSPYRDARPLVNMSRLARLIHRAQKLGYTVDIISWLSRESNAAYDEAVTAAKREWLARHLPSVDFDEIHITAYGVPKHEIGCGILFDDNDGIRSEWGEGAHEPSEIFTVLASL